MRSPPAGQNTDWAWRICNPVPHFSGILPTITISAIHGIMRTLTAESRHHGISSPCVNIASSHRSASNHTVPPNHRFNRQQQRDWWFPGFAIHVQARRNTPPYRVRHPADRQFASGCSPPSLATTQLPSATGSWHTLTRIFTVLVQRRYRRT